MHKAFKGGSLLPALVAPTLPYGGQAVMEGVMMKGTNHAAVAMRRRDGKIEILDREVRSRFPRLTKLPFLRGFFILWDMMTLGLWALRESSHRFEIDMEAEEAEKGEEAKPQDTSSPGPVPLVQNIIMGVSLVIALVIFKVLPAAAATGIFSWIGWGPFAEIDNPSISQQFLANLIEGLIKLSIFVGYIWSVGRIKEIERVFQYHGAEHIVINAYEADQDRQEIPFIQSHSVAHPRCGTSFIAILIVTSIILFTLMDWVLLEFGAPMVSNLPVWWLRWPLRILGLLPLAGISYEIIKSAFKYFSNPAIRPLLKFGMIFQALTTRRPTDDQIRVSLASFNRARYLTEQIPEPEA